MNCNNNQNNNNGCGCNCNPHPTPAPEPVDINMSVCDRNINMLPMLQTYTTKVLKPNVNGCCKKNILKQCMMNCENYKYVIKWDFDLGGQTITVPENCILEFDGGSLKNGTIIGQDTVFINVGDVDIWGDNLTRLGTWREHSGGGGGSEEDKPYDPEAHSGLGRKTLQLKDGSNILTQSDFDQANTVYVVGYDFDLDGADIQMPEGCVLEFEGGSFSNGKLISNNTIINGLLPNNSESYYGTFSHNGKALNYDLKIRKDVQSEFLGGFFTQGEYMDYIYCSQDIVSFYYNDKKYFLLSGSLEDYGSELNMFVLLDEYYEYAGSTVIPFVTHGQGLTVANGKIYVQAKSESAPNPNIYGYAVFNISDVVDSCRTETSENKYTVRISSIDFVSLPYSCYNIDYDEVNEEFAILGEDLKVRVLDKDFVEKRCGNDNIVSMIEEYIGLPSVVQGIVFKNGIVIANCWNRVYPNVDKGATMLIHYDTLRDTIIYIEDTPLSYALSEPEGICKDPDSTDIYFNMVWTEDLGNTGNVIGKLSQVNSLVGVSSKMNAKEHLYSSVEATVVWVDNSYDFSNGFSTGSSTRPFKTIGTALLMCFGSHPYLYLSIKGTEKNYHFPRIRLTRGTLHVRRTTVIPTVTMNLQVVGAKIYFEQVNVQARSSYAITIDRNGYVELDSSSSISGSSEQDGIRVQNGGIIKMNGCQFIGLKRAISADGWYANIFGKATFNNCYRGIYGASSIIRLGQCTFNNCDKGIYARSSGFISINGGIYFNNCVTCFDLDSTKIDTHLPDISVVDCTNFILTDDRSTYNIIMSINVSSDLDAIIAKVNGISNNPTAIAFRITHLNGVIYNDYKLPCGVYYFTGSDFRMEGHNYNDIIINNGVALFVRDRGLSSTRPEQGQVPVGFEYFDTELNRPIYWIENKWIYADGTDVI